MPPWTRRQTLSALGAAALAGCAGRRDPASWTDANVAMDGPALWIGELLDLLSEHARRYPKMEPADLYKALHQRAMGPGHLVSAGDALAWLQQEAAELAPLPAGVEDVDVEVLDAGKGLARVHLRPWVAQGRSLEALATAFSETAARWTPEPRQLTSELMLAVGLITEAAGLPLAFDQAAWDAFTAPLLAQGLPAVHHSETYRAAYAPAYRVVLVELIAGR